MSEYNLINMNGRVYDPWLGLMLSPDPILQAPANSQNYNRYTYAMNNPLKYTDPTGYRFGPGNLRDENGVYLKDDMPGYQEEGVFSFGNAIYDQRGALMSFGFGGNNFNNNGFSGSYETFMTINEDGEVVFNTEYFVRDNFVEKLSPGHWERFEYGIDWYSVDANGNKTKTDVTYKYGVEWVSDVMDWTSNHFYIGAEGEFTYGVQLRLGLKNGLAVNFAPEHKILLKGNYSNREKLNVVKSKDTKRNDYGFAYYIGVNISQQVTSRGGIINTLSIGAGGIFGVTLNYNRNWDFQSGYGGIDISGKVGAGYGASGALQLGFIF